MSKYCVARAVTVFLAASAIAIAPGHAQSPKPFAAPSDPSALSELGVWIDNTGKGAVEIASCGDKLCGVIVWLDQPVDAKGQPVTDSNNPEKSKRAQPVCGLQIIGNLVRQKDGGWDKGWVYDPNTGDTFDLAIKLKSPERLDITGYAGIKLLSETYTWTRAPAAPPLPRCAASVPARP